MAAPAPTTAAAGNASYTPLIDCPGWHTRDLNPCNTCGFMLYFRRNSAVGQWGRGNNIRCANVLCPRNKDCIYCLCLLATNNGAERRHNRAERSVAYSNKQL
jgi:hypothetical protein